MNARRKPTTRTLAAVAAVVLLVLPAGCGDLEDPSERSEIGGPVVDPDQRPQMMELPQEAPCTIHVEGYGHVDIEEDYIPNVVACENGNAPMEALKAQAIQARGFIYYKIFIVGTDSVVNSEADQVYDCDYADAEPRHFEAARATRAEYLSWNGQVIAPFYVAGAHPADPDDDPPEEACQGTSGPDPTDTEGFVTYNHGRSGCDIQMTTLGWVPDSCHDNPQNRGCASQNGQSCLADKGWNYEQMQPYYYGQDVEIERAGGECGGPWEQPTEYDLYCADQNDGWSCFDDTERLLCDGDEKQDLETCPYRCTDDQCDDPPEDEQQGFCAEDVDEDGWHCFNDVVRVQCSSGELVTTRRCNAGCDDRQCVPTGQSPRDDGDTDADDDSSHGEASLVTPSEGVAGGCHSLGVASGVPPAWLPVVLSLLVGLRRPKHATSCRTTGRRHRPTRG